MFCVGKASVNCKLCVIIYYTAPTVRAHLLPPVTSKTIIAITCLWFHHL